MAQRTQLDDSSHPLLRKPTPACLLANGLGSAGEALRILVNEASRIERAQHLQATPYERSAQRVDYANGYKNKTVLTRMGEVTFEVPQVRSGGFYRLCSRYVLMSCRPSPEMTRYSGFKSYHSATRIQAK
jgi:putative transposase